MAQRPGRARPVADAPVDELVGHADELARRWAVSLLAARALAEMANVPLQQLARQAPALCAQLSRALCSDAELAQLLEGPGGRESSDPERPATSWAWIAAGGGASDAVHDIEALRSVIWTAVRELLRDPPASQVADLADRLAFVCACVLGEVLAQRVPLAAAGASRPSAPRQAEQVLYSSPPSAPGGRRAVLIDELADAGVSERAGARTRGGAGAGAGEQPRGGAQRPATPRARPWDTPLNVAATDERPPGPRTTSWPAVPERQSGLAVHISRGRGSPVDERVGD